MTAGRARRRTVYQGPVDDVLLLSSDVFQITLLINSDCAAKTLVEPFSVRIPSRMGFHIVSPRDLIDTPSVRRFTDWALARFGSRDILAS